MTLRSPEPMKIQAPGCSEVPLRNMAPSCRLISLNRGQRGAEHTEQNCISKRLGGPGEGLKKDPSSVQYAPITRSFIGKIRSTCLILVERTANQRLPIRRARHLLPSGYCLMISPIHPRERVGHHSSAPHWPSYTIQRPQI